MSIDQWSNLHHKYDLISCLNLLDRCDNPASILKEAKKSLTSDGLLLVALVLPFRPFIEARNSRDPHQLLNIEGSTFIEQVDSFAQLMQHSYGFELQAWSRVPYLCQGDLLHSVYYLDDALFLFKHVSDDE